MKKITGKHKVLTQVQADKLSRQLSKLNDSLGAIDPLYTSPDNVSSKLKDLSNTLNHIIDDLDDAADAAYN